MIDHSLEKATFIPIFPLWNILGLVATLFSHIVIRIIFFAISSLEASRMPVDLPKPRAPASNLAATCRTAWARLRRWAQGRPT